MYIGTYPLVILYCALLFIHLHGLLERKFVLRLEDLGNCLYNLYHNKKISNTIYRRT